jgi:hypothetical protein
MMLWPVAIGWRRYFQGLLIHSRHSKAVANAGLGRLAVVAIVLAIGFRLDVNGAILAASALILGVTAEAILVTVSAKKLGATIAPPAEEVRGLPTDMLGICRFYWPLASSMLVVWGGRALLIGVIARAYDGALALAAWPAAWGLVLVVANATRMVQQIIIRNRREVEQRLLIQFALSVGFACSAILLLMSATPIGGALISSFVGKDEALVQSVQPVVLLCAGVPVFVALQNAAQGFLIGDGRTHRVNVATWLGTACLLGVAFASVAFGLSGALAAACAMLIALLIETIFLASGINFNEAKIVSV